jgi:hypothetical protein
MTWITHVAAGPFFMNDGRVIQVCAACGAILRDNEHEMAPVGQDGGRPQALVWETNRLVRMTIGLNPSRAVLLPETLKLPDDFCLNMIELDKTIDSG